MKHWTDWLFLALVILIGVGLYTWLHGRINEFVLFTLIGIIGYAVGLVSKRFTPTST